VRIWIDKVDILFMVNLRWLMSYLVRRKGEEERERKKEGGRKRKKEKERKKERKVGRE
jgi:hypothetical protein